MEASALTRVSGRGLLARRSPLLRFESDERLVDLIRAGHDGAFEVLFTRYNSRLLGFCQSMVKSRQDAEDVLQEVFTNAHSAMLADERKINVRPWLYRIARNRCLNHLRKAVPEGQDSMDVLPHSNGITTAEHVQNREDLRQLMADVETLPETQRTALLLREIDQLAYDEIAQAMGTTVPSVKSLLVRARIGLAESGQARLLTCEEVQVTLAEAAEGIGKASGAARKHVRDCEGCKAFRDQLRSDRKAMAALFPIGVFALFKQGILAKIFGGGSAAGTAAGGSGAAVGGASAASGMSGVSILGGAIGAKAVAGFATAAILTAGAVEVRNMDNNNDNAAPRGAAVTAAASAPQAAAPDARFAVDAPFADRTSHSAPAKPEPTDTADRSPNAVGPETTTEPKGQDETSKPGIEDPAVTEEPVADDGDVAIGTPVDPATPTDTGDQDTGSAPEDPTTTTPTTPTTPTVPTTPVGGPQPPPSVPPVDPTVPPAASAS